MEPTEHNVPTQGGLSVRGRLLWQSYRELGKTRTLVLSAMLLALALVLGRFSVYITPTVKFSFAYVPIAVAGLVCGPWAAMLVGALSDLLGVLLFPAGTFFPGYTLTALLTGLVFGAAFYGLGERAPGLWRVALARGLIVVCLHMGLNTLWSSILYGEAFFALLPARALKSVLQYPVDVLLLWLLFKALVPRVQRWVTGTGKG